MALTPSRMALLRALELTAELATLRQCRLDRSPELAELEGRWLERRAELRTEMVAESRRPGDIRLLDVQRTFHLNDLEIDLLLLALLPQVDPDFFEQLGRGRETWLPRVLDVALLSSLRFFTVEARLEGRALLGPSCRLVRSGLLTIQPPTIGSTNPESEVRVTETAASFLLEWSSLSGTLGRYCERLQPRHQWSQIILPEADKSLVWDVVSGRRALSERLGEWGYTDVLPGGNGVVFLFSGPPGTGKTALAHALADRLGVHVLSVRVSHLIASREPILPLLQDVLRLSKLEGAIVLLDDCEALLTVRDARLLAMLEALDDSDAIVVMTTNLATELDFAVNRRIQCRVDFDTPPAVLREQIWEVHLPPEAPVADDIDLLRLAMSYEFTGGTIRNAVLVALSQLIARGDDRLSMKHLVAAADTQVSTRFDGLARRSAPTGRFEDLILPEEPRQKLMEALAACRVHEDVLSRWGFARRLSAGRGICILFDGPPGTGKSYAAELLASELRLPLYRIHLPNIVSKWVGETERNIAELFVRARSARAVLLFDEADALFGRRTTQVNSATDKYANMEVNLLLQEIERYDGITALTTNLFGNLDEALQRRIQYRVTFPSPEPDERARIWLSLLPPETPAGPDVDLPDLGRRFDLAGGHIKNAILRAAYAARSQGDVVRQTHLIAAALAECQAQGKLVRTAAR